MISQRKTAGYDWRTGVILFLIAFHLLLDNFLLLEAQPWANGAKLVMLAFLGCAALAWGRSPTRLPLALALTVLYAILVIQGLLLVPFSEDVTSTANGALVFMTKTAMLLIWTAMCLGGRRIRPSQVVNLWVALGVLFALQSCILFVAIYVLEFDLPSTLMSLPRLNQTLLVYHPWGFWETPPRVQGYFSEANKFAQFLLLPGFALLAGPFTPKRVVALVILWTGFFLTLSISGLAGVLAGVAIFYGMRGGGSLRRYLLLGVFLSAVGLGLGYITTNYLIGTPDRSSAFMFQLTDRSDSVEGKTEMIQRGFTVAAEHPFGIGQINRLDSRYYEYGGINSAAGIFQLLVSAGWFGLVVHGIIWLLSWRLIARQAQFVTQHRRGVASLTTGAALFAMLVTNIVHGPFDQRLFIIMLALFVVQAHRDREEVPA